MATTTVEMGETGVLRASGARLQASGLGACVGLCLYEPLARIAVLVHVVLPRTLPPVSVLSAAVLLPGKCADSALMHALSEVTRNGGQIRLVRAALVGGAQIFTPFSTGPGDLLSLSHLEIGQRNVRALKDELQRVGIPLCAEETGGHGGRTVTLDSLTGALWVRPVGLPERLLVLLGKPPAVPVLFRQPGSEQPSLERVGSYGN